MEAGPRSRFIMSRIRLRRPRPGIQPVVGDEIPVHEPLADKPCGYSRHLGQRVEFANIVAPGEFLELASFEPRVRSELRIVV